ncbi:MAG: ribonuclease Y [Chloroflexi bacterium]|nr:ribonuclease Y [Chloroflexota bacterium]
MPIVVIIVLAVLAALGVGGAAGYFLRSSAIGKGLAKVRAQAAQVLEEAEEKKKALLLEVKEEALKARAAAEVDLRERRAELQRTERRLAHREESLEHRSESLERRERAIPAKEKELEALQAQLEELKVKGQKELEAIAGITATEARELILRKAEADMQHELALRYRELEQRTKEEADQKARKIVSLAIQRLAVDVVSESTVTAVPLPNDEMKGRLIGREGRNIRAIEQATGVDLIIDDTPEAVTISCFDPVRREVARLALQKLILDGRIHPARVEETVEKARQEVDQTILEAGQQAVFDAGVRGLNPEMVKLLGRLKYRYSYGGNVLKHSVEVSLLASMMAAECGANMEVAKMAGLLHDIGKALTHEVEGTHAEIGADVAAKYGIPQNVQRAIMEHHDEEIGSVEAFLVVAADAISAARPGSRKDTLEYYVKRLEALEAVANSFPGIEKSYAIQAGREIRIMVKPDQIDDATAAQLARDICKKIQENLVYPGQIKVVVIRETRSVEFAR